jgi:hypothetical protein
MQVVMVMFRADGERRSFSLTRDLTVIGRREDCDLRIPLGDVSRKHCRVVRSGDVVSLEDLGSSNGTFVNGQRITETVLNAGDTVQIGPVVFCVQIDGVPAEEDMAPIFTSPQEPVYPEEEAAVPMDEGVAVEGSQVGYDALETLAEEEAEVEAELDDFEPVEADDVQPVAEASAEQEPTLESLEEAEAVAAEPGAEPVAEGEEAFIDDEAAAQADLIAQPLEDEQSVEDGDLIETEQEVSLDEFEVIEEPAAEEGDETGEAHADRNRH